LADTRMPRRRFRKLSRPRCGPRPFPAVPHHPGRLGHRRSWSSPLGSDPCEPGAPHLWDRL